MKNLIQNEKTSLQNKIDKIPILTKHLLERNQNQYVSLLNKLEILNPLLTIKRGYSITKKDDKVITSVKDLKKDDTLQIQLQDGSVLADVEKIITN